jgi:uncharacterized RDD family membrane protein YckC
MPWPFRKRGAPRAPLTLRRSFVTPEGVDLRLELGTAGARAVAFVLDVLMMLAILIIGTIAIGMLVSTGKADLMIIVWLIGFFVLRNGWFVLFEGGSRGATPGKRVMGLRVIARDGAPLTGGAVIARNAMREIEVFLPLSFIGMQSAEGTADAFLVLFGLAWSGIFLFFPLTNRDRLRIGDLVGGTWVVRTERAALGIDLGAASTHRRRIFSAAALDLYGVYELQTLEDVLRSGNLEAVTIVADTIRAKAGIVDDGNDVEFLADYYRALCAHLERGVSVGQRRDDKFAPGLARRKSVADQPM